MISKRSKINLSKTSISLSTHEPSKLKRWKNTILVSNKFETRDYVVAPCGIGRLFVLACFCGVATSNYINFLIHSFTAGARINIMCSILAAVSSRKSNSGPKKILKIHEIITALFIKKKKSVSNELCIESESDAVVYNFDDIIVTSCNHGRYCSDVVELCRPYQVHGLKENHARLLNSAETFIHLCQLSTFVFSHVPFESTIW